MVRGAWRPAFLQALRQTGNITAAATLAGISRKAAYNARQVSLATKEQTFARDWDEAIEQATDLLEMEARRRAVSGVDEPVYYQGVQVGTIRKYSDTLLIVLLKGHRPKKYRERYDVAHSGRVDSTVEAKAKFEVVIVDPLEDGDGNSNG